MAKSNKPKNEDNEIIRGLSEKIKSATTVEELETLNGEVLGIYGEEENIPAAIQELANKRFDEIQGNVTPKPQLPSKKLEGWKKITVSDMKAAEKAGTLIGWDEANSLALIKKD